ncbi:MAG: orotate phosphoribosyltransferase [Oscillospiraceae bacterium]
MEARSQEISCKKNKDIRLTIIPGHFATSHSHINYYVDLTAVKVSHRMAKAAGEELSSRFRTTTNVDTIVCLEGTEVVGAFLANDLVKEGHRSFNTNKSISVLTPEPIADGRMFFRDNVQKMVWGKDILLLVASATTGKTTRSMVDCIRYYNGRVVGLAALFSAAHTVEGLEVQALFTEDDLPHYETFRPNDCQMCQGKQKIDALVNSYGYSKL